MAGMVGVEAEVSFWSTLFNFAVLEKSGSWTVEGGEDVSVFMNTEFPENRKSSFRARLESTKVRPSSSDL